MEFLSDVYKKISAINFFAIGIGLIVLWLLISGVRKGLKKEKGNKGIEENTSKENQE